MPYVGILFGLLHTVADLVQVRVYYFLQRVQICMLAYCPHLRQSILWNELFLDAQLEVLHYSGVQVVIPLAILLVRYYDVQSFPGIPDFASRCEFSCASYSSLWLAAATGGTTPLLRHKQKSSGNN